MSLSLSSLSSIPISFASCSIGKPTTPLTDKLNALHKAGFRAIELSMPDLVNHANIINKRKDVSDSDYKILTEAASDIKQTLDNLGFQVMLMQPFANFEGWPRGSKERKEAFERAHAWINIMSAVGCKTLQVGSTDTLADKISTDRDVIVQDLRELADLLKERDMRLAYENWCWSTHAPGWAEVWDIVQKVDRDNVGLCLDTFQTAGGEWGDPRTKSGLVEVKGGKEALEKQYKESLDRLSSTVPKDKIYLLQISDAYRMEDPVEDKEVDGLRPRGRWSHDFRPLPFDGYLPTVEMATAVLKTGFRGWFSYEVFDTPPWKKDAEVEDLEGFAFKAMACQGRFLEACSKLS